MQPEFADHDAAFSQLLLKLIDFANLVRNEFNSFDLFVPPLDRTKLACARADTRRELRKALVALQIYHREHGKFPEVLKQLVPEYLPEIPVDPMVKDGKLQYRQEGQHALLWSLWLDAKNDDGFTGYSGMWEVGIDFTCPVFAPGTSMDEMQAYYDAQEEQRSQPAPISRLESTRDR